MSASDHAATLADAVTVGVISSVSDTQGDDCGPSCGAGGWIAAAIAALCFGTYGVPIKATLNIEVHPLVLQSYKTIVLFLTCWFVVFAGEDTIRFTRWGILSGKASQSDVAVHSWPAWIPMLISYHPFTISRIFVGCWRDRRDLWD